MEDGRQEDRPDTTAVRRPSTERDATLAPEGRLYRAPAWLPGISASLRPPPAPAYRRTRWETPDGDFIDVDRAGDPAAPLIVLFHGLEGSSQSHYARALALAALRSGRQIAIPHFRGCCGELNRAPRAYHSGDSDEIDWVLRRFAAEPGSADQPLFAAGVSLGGNALLKWLGERGDAAGFVRAAAAVCPPQDLHAGAVALSRGFSRVYTRHFLSTLKRKSLGKLAQHPGLFDRERMLAARSFHEFDDVVTAPIHGFRDCRDYWTRSSCKPLLGGIRVPTLVLNALNDPFLPARALARRRQVSREVRLEYPREGGHVGFIGGAFPGNMRWFSDRLLDFLGEHAGLPAGAEPITEQHQDG